MICARFGDVRDTGSVPPPDPARWRGPAPGDWRSSLDRAAYTAGVRRIREYIAAGEVYQVNLCRILSAPLPDPARADVEALSAVLARGNPAPYAGVVRLPAHGTEVATASPSSSCAATEASSSPARSRAPAGSPRTCGTRTGRRT